MTKQKRKARPLLIAGAGLAAVVLGGAGCGSDDSSGRQDLGVLNCGDLYCGISVVDLSATADLSATQVGISVLQDGGAELDSH